ncbi:hypothetical protein SDC9_180038 [bioreactor metagenome]|uniref:Uncharacterized protein n=1 Tax=bioreactor metagenome TaxID=1076179 RepID=A0A645H3I7_9ZZZZ
MVPFSNAPFPRDNIIEQIAAQRSLRDKIIGVGIGKAGIVYIQNIITL